MSNPRGNGSNSDDDNGKPPNGDTRKKRIRERLVEDSLADDLLIGAEEIAEYIYGDRALRRKIFYLRKVGRIPIFSMSAQLCARKSTLRKWIEEQEERGSRHPLRPAGGRVATKPPSRSGGSHSGRAAGRNPEGLGPDQPS